jgi:hypothetical protein
VGFTRVIEKIKGTGGYIFSWISAPCKKERGALREDSLKESAHKEIQRKRYYASYLSAAYLMWRNSRKDGPSAVRSLKEVNTCAEVSDRVRAMRLQGTTLFLHDSGANRTMTDLEITPFISNGRNVTVELQQATSYVNWFSASLRMASDILSLQWVVSLEQLQKTLCQNMIC